MQGSAAAKCDVLKYRGNNGHHHPGHNLLAASMENRLSGEAFNLLFENFKRGGGARGPAVTKCSFLAGTHRKLSAALIKCQGSVYRGCANLKVRAAGRQVSPGAEVPYED